MKKEINELLNSKHAILKINKIIYIHRWQRDGIGDPVDRLMVEFDSPTGRVSFYTEEIKTREPEEIIKAVKKATIHYMEKWLGEILKQLNAGHIDGKLKKLE